MNRTTRCILYAEEILGDRIGWCDVCTTWLHPDLKLANGHRVSLYGLIHAMTEGSGLTKILTALSVDADRSSSVLLAAVELSVDEDGAVGVIAALVEDLLESRARQAREGTHR